MSDELTALQEAERGALVGDRGDALTVVTALRRYRAAVADAVTARNNSCDAGMNLGSLARQAEAIESDPRDDGWPDEDSR